MLYASLSLDIVYLDLKIHLPPPPLSIYISIYSYMDGSPPAFVDTARSIPLPPPLARRATSRTTPGFESNAIESINTSRRALV